MGLALRLSRAEAGLSPTQLVVRWLDEAHAYGSLDAYVAALFEEPPERYPLTRLLREATASVPIRPSTRRGEDADRAVRKALRETAFRFELVMRINVSTHELIDRHALIHVALGAHLALLAFDCRPTEQPDPTHDQRLSECLAVTDQSVTELMASDEARLTVETRFLAGHSSLFPDEAARFAEQLHETQRLTVLAMRSAELYGLPPGAPGHPEAVAERAETLVTNLVEPARVTALGKLDEGRQAFTVATNWLQKLARNAEPQSRTAPTR